MFPTIPNKPRTRNSPLFPRSASAAHRSRESPIPARSTPTRTHGSGRPPSSALCPLSSALRPPPFMKVGFVHHVSSPQPSPVFTLKSLNLNCYVLSALFFGWLRSSTFPPRTPRSARGLSHPVWVRSSVFEPDRRDEVDFGDPPPSALRPPPSALRPPLAPRAHDRASEIASWRQPLTGKGFTSDGIFPLRKASRSISRRRLDLGLTLSVFFHRPS